MRLLVLCIFLTLVGALHAPTLTWAATTSDPVSEDFPPLDANDLDIIYSNSVNDGKIFRYKDSYTFSLGMILGSYTRDGDSKMQSTLGASWVSYRNESTAWEYGADFVSDDSAIARAGHMWYFNTPQPIRFFAELGGACALVPSDLLATFINSRNFELRLLGGIETLISKNDGFRADLGIASGFSGPLFLLNTSYVYSW